MKIIKILKIIGLSILSILSIIGTVFLIVFFSKKKKTGPNKYVEKINKLLQEKKKDEEIITNSNIDDYDEHGNYVTGVNRRTKKKTNTIK